MADAPLLKLVVFGDVCGAHHTLFTRLHKIHTQHGPFVAALCLGTFFSRTDAQHTELQPYLSGAKTVPVPTYFIAGDETHADLLAAHPNGGTLAPNLHYLGRSGICDISGLRVAFLSGTYDAVEYTAPAASPSDSHRYSPAFSEHDVLRLIRDGLHEPIDVLLTCEWPAMWSTNLPADRLPKLIDDKPPSSVGALPITKIVQQLTARYHFAAHEDSYFELPPYRNALYFTRFLGIGSLASRRKEKSVYAFSINRWSDHQRELPADVTESPFVEAPRSSAKRAADDAPPPPSSSTMDDEIKRIRMLTSGSALLPPPPLPSSAGGGTLLPPPPPSQPLPGFVHSAMMQDAQNAAMNQRWNMAKPPRRPPPRSYICRRCNLAGHWIEDCPTRPPAPSSDAVGGGPPPADYVCNKCQQPGHYIRECPLVLAEQASRPQRASGDVPPPDYMCNKCQQSGHYIRLCPLLLAERAERDAATSSSSSSSSSSSRLRDMRAAPRATPGVSCWFCLGSPDVAQHLIGCIGNECYIAMSKGGLAPEHLLIIPIVHVATTLDCTSAQLSELAAFKRALVAYFARKSMSVVFFERNIPTRAGLHLNVHVVPMSVEAGERAREHLLAEAQQMQIELSVLDEDVSVSQAMGVMPRVLPPPPQSSSSSDVAASSSSSSSAVLLPPPPPPSGRLPSPPPPAAPSTAPSAASAAPPRPFICFELPDGTRLLHKVTKRVEGLFDFPRAALARLIGCPERIDWRACQLTEEDETRATEQFTADFAPFDPTADGAEGGGGDDV